MGVLLELDDEYRRLARAGRLPRIAPRKRNPEARAWLPIWHPRRGDWRFTVLFSNTERAHRTGHVGDWVVIYSRRPGAPEGQATVVTEWRGELRGKRVVRGREDECRRYYRRPVDPRVARWARRTARALSAA
ncbi:MAG: hypothetical protein D6689_04615 [Deltaproteobacteria bacterium]|nr:MAG: hypothetical protein D6689_04615 [Deltaproteobacteria bacterium]